MTKINLLINLTNNESNFVSYYFNSHKQNYEVIATHHFSTEKLITNSVIMNYSELRKKINSEYQRFLKQSGINAFNEVDLILPLQTPILHEVETTNYDAENLSYKKSFDESQFTLLKSYLIDFEQVKRPFRYFINQTLFDKYKQLFFDLAIKLNKVYTPTILLGHYFQSNSKYNLMIDLDDKQIAYNFYYGQKIFASKMIKSGLSVLIDDLFKNLKKEYGFETNLDFHPFKRLMNDPVIWKQRQESSLINCFNEKPAAVLELFWDDLSRFWKKILAKIFITKVEEFSKELGIDRLEKVIISKNEFLFKLFEPHIIDDRTRWTMISDYLESDLYGDAKLNLVQTYLKKKNEAVLCQKEYSNSQQLMDSQTIQLNREPM